ncbi:hypothetical protein BC830DRAFT_919202 [Chytriomyces sp. MP71]|nr:hypothetical protein BC830DRAFT_919202 [Chytriomyces sp. MP71]
MICGCQHGATFGLHDAVKGGLHGARPSCPPPPAPPDPEAPPDPVPRGTLDPTPPPPLPGALTLPAPPSRVAPLLPSCPPPPLCGSSESTSATIPSACVPAKTPCACGTIALPAFFLKPDEAEGLYRSDMPAFCCEIISTNCGEGWGGRKRAPGGGCTLLSSALMQLKEVCEGLCARPSSLAEKVSATCKLVMDEAEQGMIAVVAARCRLPTPFNF